MVRMRQRFYEYLDEGHSFRKALNDAVAEMHSTRAALKAPAIRLRFRFSRTTKSSNRRLDSEEVIPIWESEKAALDTARDERQRQRLLRVQAQEQEERIREERDEDQGRAEERQRRAEERRFAAARGMKLGFLRKTLQDALKRICVQRKRALQKAWRVKVLPEGVALSSLKLPRPPSVGLRQTATAGRHRSEQPAAQGSGEGAIGLPGALGPSLQERQRSLAVRAAATGAGCHDQSLYGPKVTRWQVTFGFDCSRTCCFSTPRRSMHGTRAWQQAGACHDAPRAKLTQSAEAVPAHGRQPTTTRTPMWSL